MYIYIYICICIYVYIYIYIYIAIGLFAPERQVFEQGEVVLHELPLLRGSFLAVGSRLERVLVR